MTRDKYSARIMVVFPILGGGAIGGFAVHRFLSGEFYIALVDAFFALSFFCLSAYTYLTGKETISRNISAVLSVMGPLVLLVNFEGIGVYWLYSSVIVLFYLVHYKVALALNVLMMLSAGFVYATGTHNAVELYSLLVTMSLIIAFSLIFVLNEERVREELKTLSLRDDLTGIGNRRAFVAKITEAINLRKRYGLPASLLYIDIDKFKLINDSFGHHAGDETLNKLSMFVKAQLRETDSVFRIGGDEFVVIAEGTDQEDAIQLAEKIRASVEVASILPDLSITLSMGVASLHESDSIDSWIARADTELYKAKTTGRNQVQAA